ncbi:MAG: NDP-hexose 2,3-dehydratase family protein [Saprospiraceae bacterium]|nr:NDP-hexose 2,3-dehydratase family protein [Saprospiraceae bacterium]
MHVNIAETREQALEFLNRITRLSKTEIVRIPMEEQRDWQIRDGVLSHRTNGFFSVAGLTNSQTGEERLMLLQPQSAITGILFCRKNSKIYVLLQARVEPGNVGVGQYGPTIQSTPANYLRWHGGNATPYVEYFNTYNGVGEPVSVSSQLDIGRRYYQKIKTLLYVEAPHLLECTQQMIWVSLDALSELASIDHVLNTDLRSMSAVMNWDNTVFLNQPVPPVPDSGILNYYFNSIKTGQSHWHITPLDKLTGWEIAEGGIIPKHNQPVSVQFYRTTCLTREVGSWVQPLMVAPGRGAVSLFFRETPSGKEYLLSILSEEGISGGALIGPTIQQYQEDRQKSLPGETIISFEQSDEGGRFIHHTSVFSIVRVENDYPAAENQFWVSDLLLKKLISLSNITSIQLRAVCSLLIRDFNVQYFEWQS